MCRQARRRTPPSREPRPSRAPIPSGPANCTGGRGVRLTQPPYNYQSLRITAEPGLARVGVVAIGRNEGDRLRRCLESLDPAARPTVYVDSGSADGSPDLARSLRADVVDLDLSVPFTAARARNAGLARLLEVAPGVEYVQFVDGDCEV